MITQTIVLTEDERRMLQTQITVLLQMLAEKYVDGVDLTPDQIVLASQCQHLLVKLERRAN